MDTNEMILIIPILIHQWTILNIKFMFVDSIYWQGNATFAALNWPLEATANVTEKKTQ